MTTAGELSRARADVDAIDDAIVELLARRRDAVLRIASLKRTEGAKAIDPAREEALRGRWQTRAAALGLDADAALEVLDAVLRHSRKAVERVVEGT